MRAFADAGVFPNSDKDIDAMAQLGRAAQAMAVSRRSEAAAMMEIKQLAEGHVGVGESGLRRGPDHRARDEGKVREVRTATTAREAGGDELMIPDIGAMIGAYIFTRMVGVLVGPNSDRPLWQGVEAFCALVTMAVTAVVVYDLVTRGASMPPIR